MDRVITASDEERTSLSLLRCR